MYQYETSPKKLTEYDEPKSAKKVKKTKTKKTSKEKALAKELKIAKINFTLILALILGCLLLVMYRNVQINESFSEVQSLQKQVASLEKENSQISVNIQNSLNLSNIESIATSTLGMQKLSNKQTVYISLDTKDYVEVSNDSSDTDESESVVENLWNKFWDMF